MLTESLQQLDSIGEVENWRSAVDPSTGRIYWYHRKTRESSWVKPSCLEELERLTTEITRNNEANEVMNNLPDEYKSVSEVDPQAKRQGQEVAEFSFYDPVNVDLSALDDSEVADPDERKHENGAWHGYQETLLDTETSHHSNLSSHSTNSNGINRGYDDLLHMLARYNGQLGDLSQSNLVSPESVIADCVSKHHDIKLKALHTLYACCIESTAHVWIYIPQCLSNVCDIIIAPFTGRASRSGRSDLIECSRLASCIFCRFSSYPLTWDYLFQHSSMWHLTSTAFSQINDATIGTLIAYSFCLLLRSDAILNLLLSDHELLVVISLWIYHTLFEDNEGHVGQTLMDCLLPNHPSTFVLDVNSMPVAARGSSSLSTGVDSETGLKVDCFSSIPGIVGLGVPLLTAASMSNIFHISKESGINLPLYVILGFNHLVLEGEMCSKTKFSSSGPGVPSRKEEYLKIMIQYNIVNILQQISISACNDEDLREVAKQQLLTLMATSATVRESILSSHLSLSSQLQSIPEVVFPDKVEQKSAKIIRKRMPDGSISEVEVEAESDEGAGIGTGPNSFYQKIVSEYQQSIVPTPIYRDVEWKPQLQEEEEEEPSPGLHNKPYRLTSTILWARCPSLRSILTDFWFETNGAGGGLELSLDASEHTLACLCEYIHTGILVMPLSLHPDQLDVIRIASQLDMHGLVTMAVEYIISSFPMYVPIATTGREAELDSTSIGVVQDILDNDEDFDLIVKYADAYELSVLQSACQMYYKTGEKPIIDVDVSALSTNGSPDPVSRPVPTAVSTATVGVNTSINAMTGIQASYNEPKIQSEGDIGSGSKRCDVVSGYDEDLEYAQIVSTNTSNVSHKTVNSNRYSTDAASTSSVTTDFSTGVQPRKPVSNLQTRSQPRTNAKSKQSDNMYRLLLEQQADLQSQLDELGLDGDESVSVQVPGDGLGLSNTIPIPIGEPVLYEDLVVSTQAQSSTNASNAGDKNKGKIRSGGGPSSTGSKPTKGSGASSAPSKSQGNPKSKARPNPTIVSVGGKVLQQHPQVEERMQLLQSKREAQARKRIDGSGLGQDSGRKLNIEEVEESLWEQQELERWQHDQGRSSGDEKQEVGDAYDSENELNASVTTVDPSLLVEYDASMSLYTAESDVQKVKKPQTPSERRLAKLAQPKAVAAAAKQALVKKEKELGSKSKAAVGLDMESESSTVPPKKIQRSKERENHSGSVPTVAVQSQEEPSEAEDVYMRPRNRTSVPKPGSDTPRLAPKTTLSPVYSDSHRAPDAAVVSHSNSEEYVKDTSYPTGTDADVAVNVDAIPSVASQPTPDNKIRSSLTLLKKRATSRRQSISVASPNPDRNASQDSVSQKSSASGRQTLPISHTNAVKCLRSTLCKCPDCGGSVAVESFQSQATSGNSRWDSDPDEDLTPKAVPHHTSQKSRATRYRNSYRDESNELQDDQEEEAQFSVEPTPVYGMQEYISKPKFQQPAQAAPMSRSVAGGSGNGNDRTSGPGEPYDYGFSDEDDEGVISRAPVQAPRQAVSTTLPRVERTASGSAPYGSDAGVDSYPTAGDSDEDPGAPDPTDLPTEECPHCSRKFREAAFDRHVKICEKVFVKKRKVYDSAAKYRIEDENAMGMGSALRKNKGKNSKTMEPIKKPNAIPKWKQQSGQFRAAMQAARHADGNGPPVQFPVEDNLIPCPHCNRRFNEQAAERHIPKCKDIRAKPTSLLRTSKSSGAMANRSNSRTR